MEVLEPPHPVEPTAACAQHGPAVVDGDGIFQPVRSDFVITSVSNFARASSYRTIAENSRQNNAPNSVPTTSTGCRISTPLGRTNHGILEASNPANTVLPRSQRHHSRPGPVVGSGEEVFQRASLGEYSSGIYDSRSDADSFFSGVASPNTGLNIYYQNVGGMNSSSEDFLLATSGSWYDIIAFTETWLTDNTISEQVISRDFEVFRCDRGPHNSSKVCGGGVLLAVRQGIKATLIEKEDWDRLEQLWVRLELKNRMLYICVVYLPPDRTRDVLLLEAHTRSVLAVVSQANVNDDILVIGDFNMPGILWEKSHHGFLHPDPCHSVFHIGATHLLDNYSTATLKQINSVRNANNRSLDLCFVNSQDAAPLLSLAPVPLVKEVWHHPPLHLYIDTRAIEYRVTSATVTYDFSRWDIRGISQFLSSLDWDNVIDQHDVDAATLTFRNILLYAIDQFTPKIMTQSVKYPWQSAMLRKLKTKKRAAFAKFSKRRTVSLRDHYVQLNALYKKTSRQCYARYKLRIQQKLKSNPKSFWSYVKDQRNIRGLPASMKRFDETTSDVLRICDLFADKFSSVFSHEQLSPAQIFEAANNAPIAGQVLPSIEISIECILNATTKLKSSSNPGPDGIPSVFLKRFISYLLVPLRQIFSLSLSSGKFPCCWKSAIMFPVHKKGDRRDIENYRGVSSLSAISKLLELVVMHPLASHCKQLLSTHQHGFFPKRSATTNLLCLTSYALDSMNARAQTDAVYFDLTAAFDKLNHSIAVAKLERLGVTGSLLLWFRSYLTGRDIRVMIGDRSSNTFSAFSGVPQGSHLGPLVFLVYINDVNEVIDGPKLLFADDLKLYTRVNSLSDAINLQRRLDIFHHWCETNRMTVNPKKCSVISFSRKKTPFVHKYKFAEVELQRVSQVKDLGVILDTQLTFKQHVSYIVDKSSRTLGFILRIAKSFSDVYCLKTLYCSLVRSTLEYCSTVWSPHYHNGVQRIEGVQRRFIRFALRRLPWLDPLHLPSYEDRCQLIHLETLQTRREVAKALLVADILQGNVDSEYILQRIDLHVPLRPLRTHPMLRPPSRRTNYGTFNALIGLQRTFNRVASDFDFNLSRIVLRNKFKQVLC